MTPRIFLVAGEASGDHHGAKLLTELKRLCPELDCFAAGGPALKKAGATIVVPMERLNVIGVFEVVSHLSEILSAYRIILDTIRTEQISTVILIDFPDFNLILARALKKRGLRVFYYVSPQIWAWRKGRVRTIRKVVDHMFVIFPFEADFYRSHGVPVTYAGHPLLDSEFPDANQKEQIRKNLLGEGNFPVLVLAPGSRKGEVSRLYPRMLAAYVLLKKRMPNLRALVPQSLSVPDSFYEHAEQNVSVEEKQRVELPLRIPGRFREVMGAGDCALVASGTATLETGLVGTPMVVVYALHEGTFRIARLLVKVPAIGMVNLVSGRKIVPELIQDQASPANMAKEIEAILTDRKKLDSIKRDLNELRHILGSRGASERIARQLLEMAGFECHPRSEQSDLQFR